MTADPSSKQQDLLKCSFSLVPGLPCVMLTAPRLMLGLFRILCGNSQGPRELERLIWRSLKMNAHHARYNSGDLVIGLLN